MLCILTRTKIFSLSNHFLAWALQTKEIIISNYKLSITRSTRWLLVFDTAFDNQYQSIIQYGNLPNYAYRLPSQDVTNWFSLVIENYREELVVDNKTTMLV